MKFYLATFFAFFYAFGPMAYSQERVTLDDFVGRYDVIKNNWVVRNFDFVQKFAEIRAGELEKNGEMYKWYQINMSPNDQLFETENFYLPTLNILISPNGEHYACTPAIKYRSDLEEACTLQDEGDINVYHLDNDDLDIKAKFLKGGLVEIEAQDALGLPVAGVIWPLPIGVTARYTLKLRN